MSDSRFKARVIQKNLRAALILSLTLFIMLLLFDKANVARAADIIGPDVRLIDNEIIVSTALTLDEKIMEELKKGISKEITLYVDLFRIWSMWPDEFITGKKIVNTMSVDTIKGEYEAMSYDGITFIKKRFKDFDSMLRWALNIRDIKVADIKGLEKSDYFIRVTAESRLRKLPPVIGYLLFFVPERDFRIVKDSPKFSVRTGQ